MPCGHVREPQRSGGQSCKWWERWRGPIITRDLVLYGLGLDVFDAERRRVIWGTIQRGSMFYGNGEQCV